MSARKPFFRVRRSRVHGYGAFALRRIRKGTRVCEYLGERITHREADRRYKSKAEDDNHTFLFIVDKKTVIDAGVGGNAARFINHSCDGNCESVIEKGRVWIEATRTIQPGQELGYDYEIGREPDDPDDVDEIFACRCGWPKCRGTMLWPPERTDKKGKKKASAKKPATEQVKAGQKAGAKSAGQASRGKASGGKAKQGPGARQTARRR